MSTLEHQTHYSPPPAPPDEVNVKNLVSQFSRSTIQDTETKLPPEKRKAKYLTDTKKIKHKQGQKVKDKNTENDSEFNPKDRRNKAKNKDTKDRAKNTQDDKNIGQHENTNETIGGESSSASEENAEDHQKPNRRKRQGSDDGYNSTTTSGTSSPRTSSGKTPNINGISSNSENSSQESGNSSHESGQSENESHSNSSSPTTSRGSSPVAKIKVQEQHPNKTISTVQKPSTNEQIVPKSSKSENPQHKINCKEKLSQVSSSRISESFTVAEIRAGSNLGSHLGSTSVLNSISGSILDLGSTTNLSSSTGLGSSLNLGSSVNLGSLTNSSHSSSNSIQTVQDPKKSRKHQKILKPPKIVTTSFKDLYSVRKLLSESSINKIYLGVHRTTGQEVVIKKLVKCQESLNELVYTKAASKIAPRYCLPILYSEKTNSSYVMVIPKYGLSLYDFMYERQETLSFEEARRTYKKILKALCKLQRYQIYHFDIKEENVCIDPQTLNIKLIDFGGAAQSMPSRFTGSFEFAAPEMFMKVPPKEAASAADVWSFGVSLYSAVCGVTPYTNIDEVFEPRFRRKFDDKRGDLPDDLIEVLKHTVVPEHEKRVSFEALKSFAFFR